MYSKLMFFVLTVGSLMLINCASTTQITELSTEVQSLSQKLKQINNNIDVLKPEITQAKNEAIRANKRLDNQVSLYRK